MERAAFLGTKASTALVEKGNHVQFGPGEEDNFIENRKSGNKIRLRENGKGSYLMSVDLVGGKREDIVVDSGAEENVCPWEWANHQGTQAADRKIVFRAAGGQTIPHWGRRDVRVTAPF